MSDLFNLAGQVVILTGASRGIGRAILSTLAQYGATVIGTATTDEGAEGISAHLKASGWSGLGVKFDVNDASGVDGLFDTALKQFGNVAVLVNNAGITRDQLAMRM